MFLGIDVLYPVLSVATLTEQQARLMVMNHRGDTVSVRLQRRSGTYWNWVVKCTAKATTVSPDTVESQKGLPAVDVPAGRAKC